ncbi:MAG: sigma 54-interacting transcriptional regulator [Gemmatimonadales bacterium]
MKLPGYSIHEEIHRGRKRVVCRGRRDADGRPVILKSLAAEFPSSADTEVLRREYDLLSRLLIPGTARPVELLAQRDRLVLVLEDAGGHCLRAVIAAGGLGLEAFLELGVGLTATLAELHRRGITHNDVNPGNILVDPRTGAATLIDFSHASPLPAERPGLDHPSHLVGTLAYMSPEQTGRMNREIDFRTDLYSLGASFYEILTGHPPFESTDPLEVIHGHVARTPVPPADVDPGIPLPVSAIVMKLLAKEPEDRYQSASGIQADLIACLTELQHTGRIATLVPGREDVPQKFVLPQRLYGREREVAELLRVFDLACAGTTQLLLVSGYSGIGKTSLIRELYKPLVRERGDFVAGKFDQIARSPYSGLIQALRALIQHLLTADEQDLEQWRARLRAALGRGASVLAEVLPEIELVVGPQPPATPLGAIESQNRFQLVFQQLIGAVATREHPLVIFLDDLQWADSATLWLLEPLLSNPATRHLLIIGAYRDNEVDPAHPLVRTIDTIESARVPVRRLALGPLTARDLTDLVADTLHGPREQAASLAALVGRKTGGNPFFVLQFLQALHHDGRISFDPEQRCWHCRLDEAAEAGMTDNVIELMTGRIQRLRPPAQRSLTLAACIGNRFDLRTLATVSQQPVDRAAADLRDALEAGLILPSGPARAGTAAAEDQDDAGFVFLHDRVQQAAYAMIPVDDRASVHMTVGRLLLRRWDPLRTEEHLFEVAQHLNLGAPLLLADEDRLELARINLAASRKAKASAAYHAARTHAAAGRALLGPDHWESEYRLMFDLWLEEAECCYLTGRFEDAERQADRILAQARSALDRARVYNLKILQYESLTRYADAIRTGHHALAEFGIRFPADEAARRIALEAQLEEVRALQGARTVASLIDLPEMADPESRAVMRLLTSLHTPCYLSADKILTLLNTTAMVRLSLTAGNSEESAYAYTLHAMHLGAIRGEYATAYEFGLLGQQVAERFNAPALLARALMNFSWNVSLWRRPVEESIPIARQAHRLANDTGLFVEGTYASFNDCYLTLLTARDLAETERVGLATMEYALRVKMHRFAVGPQTILQWSRALMGRTSDPVSLSDDTFSEADFLRDYGGNGLFEMFYYVARLALAYTMGDLATARASALEAERVIREYTGTIWDELTVFYHGLTLTSLYPALEPAEQAEANTRLDGFERRLQRWADNAPYLFRIQHLILTAELARIRGREGEAGAAYDRAIEAAEQAACPRERGLANELCGRAWLNRGQRKVAQVFLAEARHAYAQWGARAKASQLERELRSLEVAPVPAPGSGLGIFTTTEARTSVLDLASVMKAAQAISSEIDLDRLLAQLTRIAVENAGAERGVLLLAQDGELVVRAEGRSDTPEVRVLASAGPAQAAGELPLSIINYVRRTSENVVLADARADDQYASDPYIAQRGIRSVLCTPVLKQGQLIGVLYLENNLATTVFTPDRIEVMQLLAAQAAIALENARLFSEVGQLRDRLQAENIYLLQEIKTHHGFEEIVGGSEPLTRVLRQVEQVAAADTTVLISGETGTGKELIARAIHRLSNRRNRPLVTVNCATIPPGLVESELFGHEKGAFTGAVARKIGRFELGDGGTVFLDEIGDLPVDLQAKLLRVLQEGEFERVGGSRTVRVDVRMIAATHVDLAQAVEDGEFRSDLYYRLNVFPIMVPPLRERSQDIPLLVRYFVSRHSAKLGKQISRIPRAVMDRLVAYAWPGNVRELANIIERSVIISQGDSLEIGDWLAPQPQPRTRAPILTMDEAIRNQILEALQQTGWKVSGNHGAARLLGVKPTTLEARMKRLGIHRPTGNPNIS